HPPELGELAERMHVTSRTLIRRLKRDGTTYKQILEQLRRRYATELLLRTDLTAAAISELLGYGEPANFGRAFRRWYGTSPNQWRHKRE
ncbi:MAG: helix-turn-helix transcriptional regulator, partial [Pseudomonadota bacterium]|nr:helix-turn-helix transcriptional regulator [Pseudomonadota bacterium]